MQRLSNPGVACFHLSPPRRLSMGPLVCLVAALVLGLLLGPSPRANAESITLSPGTVVMTLHGTFNLDKNRGNMTNATESNNSYAAYTGKVFDLDTISRQLDLTNFGFAIPDSAASDATLQEWCFVDTKVAGYRDLVDHLAAGGRDGHRVEVVLLESRDRVAQIAAALAGRSGIDAIHLITRDSRAELQLGAARLTRDSTFGEYADELSKTVLAIKEGRHALVSVHKTCEGDLALRINGKTDGSAKGRDTATRLMLGHLPLFLHQGAEPVFVSGPGSGMTLGTAELYPQALQPLGIG